MSETQTTTEAPSVEDNQGEKPDESAETTTPESTDPDAKSGDEELGEAGKKALKSERDARKAADKKAAELEAEISRLRRANAANKGTDLEAIKSEIRAEYAAQIAETAIKAEAKGRLNDPADALLYIKPADVDGEDAIKAAVDQLLKDKPYLGASESGPKPWGDVGAGQRKTTEAEPKSALERMARAYGTKG